MSASSASSVLELAALGPGIAWIDSSAYLCQFMGMATTNLYATAISEGDVNKQRKVLSHATIISIGLGLFLFAIQYTFAKPLVTVLAGSAMESIPYALSYARIRSFASIIAVPTIVGQAAFLASKDSVTPLKAVLVGSVINIVGDLLLVCVLGKGIAGAAWATTLSQIGSALYLLAASVSRSMTANDKDLVAASPSTLERTAVSAEVVESRVDLLPDIKEEVEEKVPSKQSMASLVQFPGFRDIIQYISFCGPLFFVLLMKAFSWSYTTYACSPAGPVSLAAHQIVLNMFCIFAIFGDAVSQISQTYLPQFFGTQVTTRKMYDSGESLISNIMKISFSMGLFNCIFAFLVVSKYAQKVSLKRALSAEFATHVNISQNLI
jgi:Na+-driven multidrug efflux pump